MGDSQTLYEFLDFANDNYPADHVAVTFWNHGGGSVSGAAFDEKFDYDSLTLDEMYQAFDAVWPADPEDPALGLTDDQIALLRALPAEEPIQVDDLIEATGIPTRRVLSALTVLEIENLVTQHSGKRYIRAVSLSGPLAK